MNRTQQRMRQCKVCGAPSDRKALCAWCSPNRATTPHRDKYANSTIEAQSPRHDLDRRFGGRRGEFGLGVMLGHPPARSVDDDQTDHEKGDTCKDLDTTLVRLRGDLAGRCEDQNEAERVGHN